VTIKRMLEGYRAFRAGDYNSDPQLYKDLVAHGQHPDTLVIACSDSRVDPALVFKAGPGDIFTIRNVANLVPPSERDNNRHGTSAALEFAVRALEVKNIVVLGHAHCGGVKALCAGVDAEDNRDFEFIGNWMATAADARDRIRSEHPQAEGRALEVLMEQEVVRVSLDNLMSFHWIARRVRGEQLALHGWYFDIAEAKLLILDPLTDEFAEA
jgi:carbonic anhydrase